MDYLGVELHAIIGLRGSRNGRDGSIVRPCDHTETLRQCCEVITMAHPHHRALRNAIEEWRVFVRTKLRTAELALFAWFYGASEGMHHRLQTVTDAEDRNGFIRPGLPQIKEHDIELRSTVVIHGARPAGQDQPSRLHSRHLGYRKCTRMDLAVHACLAHTPSDQLRGLATIVEDDNELMAHQGYRVFRIAYFNDD